MLTAGQVIVPYGWCLRLTFNLPFRPSPFLHGSCREEELLCAADRSSSNSLTTFSSSSWSLGCWRTGYPGSSSSSFTSWLWGYLSRPKNLRLATLVRKWNGFITVLWCDNWWKDRHGRHEEIDQPDLTNGYNRFPLPFPIFLVCFLTVPTSKSKRTIILKKLEPWDIFSQQLTSSLGFILAAASRGNEDRISLEHSIKKSPWKIECFLED